MSQADAFLRELHFLGVDKTTVDVLALLPLIQVAWADGEVQEQEREAILGLSQERYHLSADGAQLLEDWLRHPPSEAYLERGRRMLVALAHARDDFDLAPEHLEDVVEFSKHVAKAAGGFLGFRAVDASEAAALEQIAAALSVGHDKAVGILHFDEDVEDESTDLRSAEEMAAMLVVDGVTPVDGSGPRLVHYQESGPTSIPATEGVTVGRSRANTVQLGHDGQISRLHFRITRTDDAFHVEDNGTTNGTWVNGERVSRRRLFGGEQIAAGSARFTFLAS
ncbi:MAG: FHA domain-containing protein [Deltaproteobacteria bacterium]|nr:MAG: FHA domain-containing protein [Deltaproteobacteria bacterium]